MATVSAHYRDLLARHYTWMVGGDLEHAAVQDRELLETLGITTPARSGAVAVDLGCGPGAGSLALADLGFDSVLAVDTSQELLDELAEHTRSRPAIRALAMDLVTAAATVIEPSSADAIVCLRDTVLHLSGRDSVRELARACAAALHTGGVFALTYRDLTRLPAGLDRFMPVHSDPDRIMLCFLEEAAPETVTVNDLVYSRETTGWDLHKSSYRKLRLSPDWLRDQLTAAGLTVGHHRLGQGGMWATVATKAT